MPLTYRYDDGRLHFHLEGNYVFEETRPVFLEALNDTRLVAGTRVLFDARRATGHPPPGVLRRAAALLRPFQPRLGAFAVVVSSALHFGLTRMFQAFAGDAIRMEVFYDVDEAENWLERQESLP